MNYEIDFLPVGNGDSSGDAIAVRWGEPGNYKVLIYDGGTHESGAELVKHVREHYQSERVDYVVCSHPDNDHASGLSVVLEELEVGALLMHRPWAYSAVIRDYFDDGRITDQSLAERLKKKMRAAHALEELAINREIPIYEPFQGTTFGPFTVLSPEQDWYIHELVPAFEKSPELKQENSMGVDVVGLILGAMRKAGEWIVESWRGEALREDVRTSAENESSVILFADFDGRGALLTGDAGIQALHRAVDYAELKGIHLATQLRFVQVPHHGSRNNVSTSALDRLVGPRKPTDDNVFTKTAFVSAGKESTTHPRKMVTNAFIRRGVKTIATKGWKVWHHEGMPQRAWGPAPTLGFSSEVESWG